MIKKTILLLALLSFSLPVAAGIRSLGDTGVSSKSNLTAAPKVNSRAPNSTATDCTSNGFILKSCPRDQKAAYPCPSDSHYFKLCCPNQYQFSQAYCLEHGMEASAESCGGMYKCNTKQQPEISDNSSGTPSRNSSNNSRASKPALIKK